VYFLQAGGIFVIVIIEGFDIVLCQFFQFAFGRNRRSPLCNGINRIIIQPGFLKVIYTCIPGFFDVAEVILDLVNFTLPIPGTWLKPIQYLIFSFMVVKVVTF
jgi:hypothetical protein